jgi:hypothetical protein
LLSSRFASADTSDDSISKACTGLSQIFYNKSKIPEDAVDTEILKRFTDLNVAALLNRAKVIGAARACGEQTENQWKTLEVEAAAAFKDSSQSKRFEQVVACTESRFAKVGLTGNWATTTLEFCPQAKQNFAFYVRDRHAFSEEAPQLNITSFGSDGANMDFATLCRDAKVQFFKKPELPVHSVAHDWPPQIRRDLKNRYELDESGKILGIGWNPKIRNHVDFIEERYTPNGRFGMGNLKPLYVRQPRQGEFYGVDNLMADVLVMHDVSIPEELDKPVSQQAQLKYTLAVSDRRTGEKLALMVYWVDMLNHRACGANLRNTIDEDVFILQAIGIPIAIPAKQK